MAGAGGPQLLHGGVHDDRFLLFVFSCLLRGVVRCGSVWFGMVRRGVTGGRKVVRFACSSGFGLNQAHPSVFRFHRQKSPSFYLSAGAFLTAVSSEISVSGTITATNQE